ncbi:MAG: alpha/beta hydrolase [SAR324 cluster bacterium]|nr:alpha/beta hydrolase [SAR324 cluster bacterium]
MITFLFSAFLISLIVLKIVGAFLDQRIDDKIETSVLFNSNGVLLGSEPISSVSQKETAVIFVHGFMDSPQVFDEIINCLSWQQADYFVPLLPFHGRGVHEMKDFEPSVVEQYISAYIEEKSRAYKKLILVGQSLGSASLIRISEIHRWSPSKIHLILMAPSVFLYTGRWYYLLAYNFYLFFRVYWRKFQKKDENIRSYRLVLETAVAYYAISAVKRLQQYCHGTEKILRQMTFPHTVLIAKDDNRVHVRRLHHACQKPQCRFILLEKGQHVLYHGEPVVQIARCIENVIENKILIND